MDDDVSTKGVTNPKKCDQAAVHVLYCQNCPFENDAPSRPLATRTAHLLYCIVLPVLSCIGEQWPIPHTSHTLTFTQHTRSPHYTPSPHPKTAWVTTRHHTKPPYRRACPTTKTSPKPHQPCPNSKQQGARRDNILTQSQTAQVLITMT